MKNLQYRITFHHWLPFIYGAWLMLGSTSCNVINPAEPVPSYLQIDSIEVYTDEATQGSNSSKLSDVWVTVDGNFLGGFSLPAKIPVLYSGSHTVDLSAGILLNGIERTRVAYGVFNYFDSAMTLAPGVVQKVVPRVTYKSSAHFPLIEDFDHSSYYLAKANGSDTGFVVINDANAFENSSGAVYLDDVHPYFKCLTTDSFDLPPGNSPIYLEINYRCNTEFTVGVTAHTSLGNLDMELLNIRTSDSWNKIYVNLTPVVSQSFSASDWKVYLYARRQTSQSEAELFFDNIKLVY